MNKKLSVLVCAILILLYAMGICFSSVDNEQLISDEEFRKIAASWEALITSGYYWEFGYASGYEMRVVLDIPDSFEQDPICSQVQVTINIYDSPRRVDDSIVRNSNMNDWKNQNDASNEKWFLISDGLFSIKLSTTSDDADAFFAHEIDRMLAAVAP